MVELFYVDLAAIFFFLSSFFPPPSLSFFSLPSPLLEDVLERTHSTGLHTVSMWPLIRLLRWALEPEYSPHGNPHINSPVP